MSNLGYPFEHLIESWALSLENKTINGNMEERSIRVPTSGAMRGMNGDIRTRFPFLDKQLLIECKSRQNASTKAGIRSVRLEKEWLDKNYEESIKDKRLSVVMINYKATKHNRIHVVMPLDHFTELIQTIKDLKSQLSGLKIAYDMIKDQNSKVCLKPFTE
jgi:hypothetical protein